MTKEISSLRWFYPVSIRFRMESVREWCGPNSIWRKDVDA